MFYHFVCDAEAKVDEFVKEGKITEEAANEIKKMFDNLTESSYENGMGDAIQYERRYQDE